MDNFSEYLELVTKQEELNNDSENMGKMDEVARGCYDVAEYERATQIYVQMIEKTSDEIELAYYYNMIGCCMHRLGKHEDEMKWFEKAVGLNQGNELYLENLKIARREMGAVND